MRLVMQIGVIAALCGIAGAAAPTTMVSEDDAAANMALARRFCQLTQLSLNGRITPETLHQSIALLKLCNRMDPLEPTYPRLLIEAYLQPGAPDGRAGAIEWLNKYLQLQPNDIYAKSRLIDLHFSQFDAADQRSRYVEQLLKTPELSPELKSHVAVLGAKLALDRAESTRANDYIEQALKLFPLSPEALSLKYDQMPDDAPAPKRVALLNQMLRSNPAQADVLRELGDIAASVGLVDAAMYWYTGSMGLSRLSGSQPSDDLLTALCEESAVADQVGAAQKMAHSLVEKDPGNSAAAFLELLLLKRTGTPEKIDAAAEAAKTAVLIRLGRISDNVSHRDATSPASTQPNTNIDIQADLAKLAESKNPTLSAAYAAGLADLAWLNIYFLTKPADAQPYMTALRQLLSADSVTLARLDGWTYLVQGQKDEARVKLSAVAASDPLSQLGMLRLDADQLAPDKLTAEARKLLGENPSGLTGAVLFEAMRDHIGLMPLTPAAEEVRAELDKFPKDFLDLVDSSKTRNFYMVKAEPLKIGHAFGEPMFVKITIANVGTYPLTVGGDGAIHTDLWFDARVAGIVQQNVPGAAFDRLGQTMLLKPHDSISQVVRVDQGPLMMITQSNPQIAMPIYGSVVINPVMQPGGVVPGPCGTRVQFSRIMQRDPSPQDGASMQRLLDQAQNGRGDVRFRAVEQLAAFAFGLSTVQSDEAKSRATDLTDIVRKSTSDRAAAVRASAMLMTATLSKPAMRLTIFKQMLVDESYIIRSEGVSALGSATDVQTLKDLIGSLAESDPDPLVKDLAISTIEVALLPPPTTQPGSDSEADPTRIPSATTAPSQLQSAPVPSMPVPVAPVPVAPVPVPAAPKPAPKPAPSPGPDAPAPDNPFGGGFKL